MEELNFPSYPLRIKNRENKQLVFDVIRKKYVHLLPEEWVRQHCIHFLIYELGYPGGRMLVEREINVAGLKKRVDLAVCDTGGNVRLLVECKAPSVRITQESFDQIARYNLKTRSDYLMVTNGLTHYFCRIDFAAGVYEFLRKLPSASELLEGNPRKS